MVFLILLLIVGLGMLGMGFINYIMKPKDTKNKNKILINGGTSMQSNGWLKLALFSFVGIIISGVVLQFMTPANTIGHQGMQGQQPMQQQSMQMQSVPQGNMNNMNATGSGQMDANIIINRLDQMQMQINQMQQMMNNDGAQMQSMPQGGMQAMPQGGMQAMPQGGMQTMPQGGMQSMPQGGMQSMPQGGMQAMPAATPAPAAMPAGGGMMGGMM